VQGDEHLALYFLDHGVVVVVVHRELHRVRTVCRHHDQGTSDALALLDKRDVGRSFEVRLPLVRMFGRSRLLDLGLVTADARGLQLGRENAAILAPLELVIVAENEMPVLVDNLSEPGKRDERLCDP
jgi:hypothetical protein